MDKGEHKGKVAVLTGTMRGKERDELVSGNPVFQRFLPEKNRAKHIKPATGTAYLVATSAGEVGVNLSADDLICDLSTYESMAQRFGRVNRFGLCPDTTITVVHETVFDSKKPLEAARERTLALLVKLNGFRRPRRPRCLTRLRPRRSVLPNSGFSIRLGRSIRCLGTHLHPRGRSPPAHPSLLYLHGEAEWQPPETHVAWREDCDFEQIAEDAIEDFLDAFPLSPRELLRDRSSRVAETLGSLGCG